MLKRVTCRSKGQRVATLIVHLLGVYEALVFVATLGRYQPAWGKLEFLVSDMCDKLEG